jgi:hypothetical protein
MAMDERERARLDKIEQAMFGFTGENGVYGDLKKLSDQMSGLYKLLAITALSILGSGLGVVVTLLSTSGK